MTSGHERPTASASAFGLAAAPRPVIRPSLRTGVVRVVQRAVQRVVLPSILPAILPAVLTVVFTAVLAVGAAASAQGLRCQSAHDCRGDVTFVPTPADVAAAIGDVLYPDEPDGPVRYHIDPSGRRGVNVDIAVSPWIGPGPLQLEMRFTLQGGGPPEHSAWQPLGQAPVRVLIDDDGRRLLTVEYRLQVSGREPVGDYAASILVRSWAEGSPPSSAQVQRQDVSVRLPAYLLLRLTGVRGSAGLSFDLTNDVPAYLAAVGSGIAIPPTSATFDALEVATNDPHGYVLSVHIHSDPGWRARGEDDAVLMPHVRLFGEPADGFEVQGRGVTDGFQPVLRPSDFGLLLDGSEAGVDVDFQVDYSLRVRP